MIKLRKFNKVGDVLTSKEILEAKTVKELVSNDYNKAYAYGLILAELLKTDCISEELRQDTQEFLEKFRNSDNFLYMYKECLVCRNDCKESGITDTSKIVEYILTTIEKLYGEDSAIALAITFAGIAKAHHDEL